MLLPVCFLDCVTSSYALLSYSYHFMSVCWQCGMQRLLKSPEQVCMRFECFHVPQSCGHLRSSRSLPYVAVMKTSILFTSQHRAGPSVLVVAVFSHLCSFFPPKRPFLSQLLPHPNLPSRGLPSSSYHHSTSSLARLCRKICVGGMARLAETRSRWYLVFASSSPLTIARSKKRPSCASFCMNHVEVCLPWLANRISMWISRHGESLGCMRPARPKTMILRILLAKPAASSALIPGIDASPSRYGCVDW